MKKIKLLLVTFSLLGVLGFAQQAQAETEIEILPDFNPSSSLQRATPDIKTVTLAHGETYKMQKKLIIPPNRDYRMYYNIKPMTKGDIYEAGYSELVNGELQTIGKDYYFGDITTFGYFYRAMELTTKDIVYEITNYSAGTATYRLGVNMGCYDTDPNLNPWPDVPIDDDQAQ